MNDANLLDKSALPEVMVVDDEECIRETVCELLSLYEIDVVPADGCAECIRLLREGFRGVILMDVMMPGKNGWQTIREIKKEGLLAGNIIFMLTAMDAPDEQMDGLQEVVVDYITKPFDPEELIATIKKYLGYLEQMETGS